jgi:hypothetical protein
LELLASPVAVAGIGRREAYLWVAICLLANQGVQLVGSSSFEALAASLAAQNHIYWLACFAVIYRLHASDPTARATAIDGCLVLVVCVSIFFASFLPYRFATGLLATLTAGYFMIAAGDDRNVRAAGVVLLALSTQLVWAPILFQLFTPELLRVDAALVGEILKPLRPDIIWRGASFVAPDGHAITLIGGCSSFNNVSTAVLACVAITMLRRTEWLRRDIATLAIACVMMILVNAARLCLLAWSIEFHAFWHDGAGAQILGIGQTFAVLLIAWWGASPRRRAA